MCRTGVNVCSISRTHAGRVEKTWKEISGAFYNIQEGNTLRGDVQRSLAIQHC